MASSSRPRRSRRLKKTPPKKRRAGVAAGKPRKAARAATNKAALKAATKKAAGKTASKAAAPGIVETALATFAHEVRTPLTGILAISDLLATSDLDERERRWVDTIKAGAEHLASLATLFVDAARSGRSGFGVRQDFFDLRTLAHSVGDSLAGRATAKGLQSRVEISEKLPAFVIGDPVRLRAALENLIDNATKFTEQGGVALTVRPTGERERQGRRGLCGFRQRHRPHVEGDQAAVSSVFAGQCQNCRPLWRRRARTVVGEATRPRHGRRYRRDAASRRRDDVHADGVAGPRRGAPEVQVRDDYPQDHARGLRVLSVEDNPFGRVVLNAVLTELGHQAEFVGRGEDALERIMQGDFDAVLMDMVLPGIDGIEAIRRIRALGPPFGAIAIIGVSGRSDDEAAARDAGADAFLVKPVSPRALAIALLEVTRRAAGAT